MDDKNPLEALPKVAEKITALERFLTKADEVFFLAIWVCLFSVIAFIIRPRKRTFDGLILSLFISIPSGVLCGGIAKELGYGDWVATGVGCFVAIVAHDVILLALANQKDIWGWVDKVINNWIDRR